MDRVLLSLFLIITSFLVWSCDTATILIPLTTIPTSVTSAPRGEVHTDHSEVTSTVADTVTSATTDVGYTVLESDVDINLNDLFPSFGSQTYSDTQGSNDSTTDDGIRIIGFNDEYNSTDSYQPFEHELCTRVDYEEDLAAVFRGDAGPLDTAAFVFNTTYESIYDGSIGNATGFDYLLPLNETVVECRKYFSTIRTRVGLGAAYSLAG